MEVKKPLLYQYKKGVMQVKNIVISIQTERGGGSEKCVRKLLEIESRVAVVNFEMGRVWVFGRQKMCDNISTPYNSPGM